MDKIWVEWKSHCDKSGLKMSLADQQAFLEIVSENMKEAENEIALLRLEELIDKIEAYEKEKYHFDQPDPIQAIEFRMACMDLKPSVLGEIIGSKSHASEVLNKRRKLSLNMIRKINKALNISADTLIRDYNIMR